MSGAMLDTKGAQDGTLEAVVAHLGGLGVLFGLILGGLGSTLGHRGLQKASLNGSRKAPWMQAGEQFSFLYPSCTKT